VTSMGQKLSPVDMALYRAIDEVLHYIWDPIGISDAPEARDEYHGYLPIIFSKVKAGDGTKVITECLHFIRTDRIGLSANLKADRDAAVLMLRWKSVLLEKYKTNSL
jgi:hypothetical protein